MNELDQLEAELRRLNPAKPPEEFMARLNDALPSWRPQTKPIRHFRSSSFAWGQPVRWLIPATAATAVVIGLLSLNWKHTTPKALLPAQPRVPLASCGLKADDVEIDQQLLGSFEAVGRLPDGEPIRFRCREWEDGVIFRDSTSGIEIEHRKPRLEVVRVSYESY